MNKKTMTDYLMEGSLILVGLLGSGYAFYLVMVINHTVKSV